MKYSYYGSIVLVFVTVIGCGNTSKEHGITQRPVLAPGPKPSPEAERLLGIAEDRQASYSERVEALRTLSDLKDRGTVNRLAVMLPGEYDVVTLEVIHALSTIGDPRALPVLRYLRDNHDHIGVPGKINTALHHAIELLEGVP